ncbi:MAG: DNA polymerase IV, partial [Caulobacteraceae bacterium]
REIGLGVSVGLATTKVLAKIASDLEKPLGFAMIGAAEAARFLAPRPVSILPGVGPGLVRTLHVAGLRTVGDLCRAGEDALLTRFGEIGARLARLARGEDRRQVDPDRTRKSISAETTFFTDLTACADLEDRLWPLCEKIARRARAERVAGRAVTLKLRTAAFRLVTRRRTLATPTQTARTLFSVTRELLQAEAGGSAFRLIGAGLSALSDSRGSAGDLFTGAEERSLCAEKAVDGLRARFGPGAVVAGRSLERGAAKSAGGPSAGEEL